MRVDLHADTPLWRYWLGYDICKAHRAFLPAGMWLSNVDVPRMQQAGLDTQVFGLVALPFEYDGFGTILTMIRHLQEAAAASKGALTLVRDAEGLAAAHRHAARAGILSIEGVHTLHGDMRRADTLIDLGVVSFGLAHFHRNCACSPAQGLGASRTRGLTPFGRDLLAHLAARKRILDLTHINRPGFDEALQHFDGRIMVSHTGVRGAYDHWRNLDDAQIRAVAERGGVIGVIFSRHFLGGTDIDAVVAHIKHLLQIGGVQCAALGSDFDGFVVPVKGLRDITGLPLLEEALQRAGFAPSTVLGVMGDNATRFLREAF